jgi:hypothetical protein
MLKGIDQALAFRPEDRPQSIAIWRAILQGDVSGTATTIAAVETKPVPPKDGTEQATIRVKVDAPVNTADSGRRPVWMRRLAIPAVCIVAILALITVFNGRREITAPTAAPDDVAEIEDSAVVTSPEYSVPSVEVPPDDADETGDPPVIATVTEPGNNTSTEPPATDRVTAQDQPDRRQFQLLRRRLQQNPGDKQAGQNLRELLARYEQGVSRAVRERNYEQAEVYLQDMLTMAPANQKLRDALQQVREQKGNRRP